MNIKTVRNTTAANIFLIDFGNQLIGPLASDDDTYTFPESSEVVSQSTELFNLIASGDLVVISSDGEVVSDSLTGWNLLIEQKQNLPLSDLGGKLAVHSSPRPDASNQTYSVWTGAGDDVTDTVPGTGDMLVFNNIPGVAKQVIDVRFDAKHGRVWLHEGHVMWIDAFIGDNMCASVVASATPLQTSVGLDLVVAVDGIVSLSPSGPGTGTHGFASASQVYIIPRTLSKNGKWDYSKEAGLSPNMTGTGGFDISTNEVIVHKYINEMPCIGTLSSFLRIPSTETTELPSGFFVRVETHNVSGTTWQAAVFMQIFRERTFAQ